MSLQQDIFDIIGDEKGRKGRFLPGSKDTFEVSGGEGLHGINLEGGSSPFLFNPKLHTASRTPGRKDSVTLRPVKTTKPSITTVGQLRKVSQALKGVPEALRTKILSRLTGIKEKDPTMSALSKIMFRHQLEAPGKARTEARSVQAVGERREATGVAQGQRQQGIDLQQRRFDLSKQESDKKLLSALKELREIKDKLSFGTKGQSPQSKQVLEVLDRVEQKILLKLLTGTAKITRRDK